MNLQTPTIENPQRWARMAGALYLLIIALGLFGELFTRGALVVPGGPHIKKLKFCP